MPMVRIDLIRGKSGPSPGDRGGRPPGPDLDRRARGHRFQVIAERDPANVIYPHAYLGLEHTPGLVMIQITFNEGRTTAQKQALFKAIAEGIHAATGSAPRT
jgi:4-oxalocrotonate tautomerase